MSQARISENEKEQPHNQNVEVSLWGDAGAYQYAVWVKKVRLYFHGDKELSLPQNGGHLFMNFTVFPLVHGNDYAKRNYYPGYY